MERRQLATAPRDASRRPPKVSLVFPPLVVEGLGRYYPSTAVLAGYLGSRGVGTRQANLNEVFAQEVLAPKALAEIGEGRMPDGSRIAVTSMPAVAARLLQRHLATATSVEQRTWLLSGPERQRQASPAYLISELLGAFVLNDRIEQLCSREFTESPQARYLRDFYARSGYVQKLGPEVHTVGMSLPMGPQLGPALILAAYLKEQRPDVKVILGGPTISLMARPDLAHLLERVPAVAAVVRYEGEVPLGLLVEQRDQGRWDPFVVPGVTALKDGRLHETPPVSGIRLEDLAYPEYDPALLATMPDSPIGIVQARGCYWGRCTYCDYVELYEGSPRYRTRLPESFVDEMEYQVATHQRRNFTIITESIPASFARKMSEAILVRRLDVTWNSFAMVDRRFIVIGLETLNARVLKLVEKAADREMNLEFLRCAKRVGLRLRVNLIVDLPTTTHAEALEDLETLESVRECFDSIAVFPYEPTRSSAVGRSPGRFGLQMVDSCGDGESSVLSYVSNRLGCVDPAMTAEERQDALERYLAFADSVNRASGPREVRGRDFAATQYFRLADEHLDIVRGSSCFNWVTRKQVTLTQDWSDLLELAGGKPRFRRAWFERQFASRAEGKRLFDLLLEEKFLRPCDDPPARAPVGSSP